MSATERAPERAAAAELRGLFLFEDLDEEQLAWVAEHGDVVTAPAGTDPAVEGETAECFYVLLEGTLSMVRRAGRDEVELVRTSSPGVYGGAVQFYLGDQVDQRYPATVRAVTDCRLLALPAAELRARFASWFPMAVHLLQGLFVGQRNAEEVVGQRERLLALGTITAALTHELNNPAAAAARAAALLSDRVALMRHKLAALAEGRLDQRVLHALTAVQEEFVARAASAEDLGALARADLEDELTDHLEDLGVAQASSLAEVFAASGLASDDLDRAAGQLGPADRAAAFGWLAAAVEMQALLREVDECTARISHLLDAARQYTQMDRSPFQETDLVAGLRATLTVLGGKIGPGVVVEEDFDPAVPRVPGYPAELNQVWTNLVVNALDAVAGSGTLLLRTALEDDRVLVEVVDSGPGVPEELRQRIFEPFFTTKPVGAGTGLGLDVSWRIVVKRHHGDLRVVSRPGRTRFQVRLPLRAPERDAAAPGA